jgi:hypothetical protein
VTGYSIGGAMSVLLAKYLAVNGYQVTDVVTFGQPKVTDAAGAGSFADLPLLRFVNHRDPVPHMPPDGIGESNLVHFGPEVVLYDGSDYAYLDSSSPNYEGSMNGSLLWILFSGNFNEHGQLYVDRLGTKLDQPTRISYRCE